MRLTAVRSAVACVLITAVAGASACVKKKDASGTSGDPEGATTGTVTSPDQLTGSGTGGAGGAGPIGTTTGGETTAGGTTGDGSTGGGTGGSTGGGDLPIATFSASAASTPETTPTVLISASLDLAGESNCVIAYSLSGAATVGSDYAFNSSSAGSGSVTIPAGNTSGSWLVTVTNDASVEGDETVVIGMTPSSGCTASNSGASVTIVDNPMVEFDLASSNGSETSTSPTINVNLSRVGTVTCFIDYAVTGGTAIEGATDDFDLLGTGTLEIDPGQTTKVLPVSVNNDAVYESNETFVVTLSNPVNCGLGLESVHTYTINNDESVPTYTFSAASSNGSEATASGTLTVNLSGATSATATVDYAVTGTATAGGVDHTTTGGTLTFSPGVTSRTISISGVNNDALDEDPETIVVTLSNGSGINAGADTAHTYTINDNDPLPSVGFTLTSSQGDESVDGVLDVELSAVSGRTVTVNYAVNGGSTATGGGTDYTLASGSLTFSPGQTSKTITIDVNNESDPEGDETVIVDLSGESNATLGTSAHTYTINANDQSYSVQFTAPSTAGSETAGNGVSLAVEVLPSGTCGSAPAITVDYDVDPSSTATEGAGNDWVLNGGGTLNIGAGACSGVITIDVANDSLFEITESAVVKLSNPTNAGLGANDLHSYNISDNDNVTIGFGAASSNGEETVSSPTITITLSAAAGTDVSVNYAVDTGSSTASGSDYSLASGTATITAGQTSTTVPLTIVNDSTPDGGEVVDIDLSAQSPGAATLGTATHSYTIDDSADVAAAPNPSPLAIIVNSGTEATLHWTSGGGTTNDYRIAYKTGSNPSSCSDGAATLISESSVDATKLRHKITGLVSGTTYYFMVCATNTSNPVAASAGATVSATVASANYPPACDSTVSAAATFASFQSTLDAAAAGSDGIKTVCINDQIAVTNASGATDNRLSIPSSHFFIRSTSGRAFIRNQRTGAGATENTAIYASGRTNVSIYGVQIETDGTNGYGVHAASGSSVTRIASSLIETDGSHGYGIYLDGSSLVEANDVAVTTKGDYGHGIHVKDGSSVEAMLATKLRRSSLANASPGAVGFFVQDSGANGGEFFNSSSSSNWATLYVCGINAATVTWDKSHADSSGGATAWGNAPAYAAYNGSNAGAQTFPSGQSGVTTSGTCPASWTLIWDTIVNVIPPDTDGQGGANSKLRCGDSSCHVGGAQQNNKWNLSSKQSAFDDGIARGWFCVTCNPTTTRATCVNSNFIGKVTSSSQGTTLFSSSTSCSQAMPNNQSGNDIDDARFQNSEIDKIREWMEAGAKND